MQGKLFIISGSSGVGKGTLISRFMQNNPSLLNFQFRRQPASPERERLMELITFLFPKLSLKVP